MTNIRRNGNCDDPNGKARSILVSFSNSWTVKKLLARAHRIRQFNGETNTNVFISRSLDKKEQQKKRQILTKRYKLITEQNYVRKFTI